MPIASLPHATVLLWAEDLPLLLKRNVGKGTSLVFVGTPLGEARDETETPFWTWHGWPDTLAKAILPWRADDDPWRLMGRRAGASGRTLALVLPARSSPEDLDQQHDDDRRTQA